MSLAKSLVNSDLVCCWTTPKLEMMSIGFLYFNMILKTFEIYCLGRLSRGLRQTAGNYCLVFSVSGCRWWIEGCQTIAPRMMSCPPANHGLNSISHQSASERLRQLLNSKNAGCRLGDAFITDCFHALRNSQENKTKKHNRPNSTRIASIFLRLQVQKWKLPSGIQPVIWQSDGTWSVDGWFFSMQKMVFFRVFLCEIPRGYTVKSFHKQHGCPVRLAG